MRVEATGSVAHHQRTYAECRQDAYRESELLGRMALVEVAAALHRRHRLASQGAQHQAVGMPLDAGSRKTSDIRIGQRDSIRDSLSQLAQAAAENQPDAWLKRAARPNVLS